MFSSCDVGMSGLVSTWKLVELVSSFADQNLMETWKVDKLCNMLDPSGENISIDEKKFVSIGKSWIESVMLVDAGHYDNNDFNVDSSNLRDAFQDEFETLNHQLDKVKEENLNLVRSLTASEDLVSLLSRELEEKDLKEAALKMQLEDVESF